MQFIKQVIKPELNNCKNLVINAIIYVGYVQMCIKPKSIKCRDNTHLSDVFSMSLARLVNPVPSPV